MIIRMVSEISYHAWPASPLVRQTLPNAAAICQQYFGFKRDFNQPMNTFLVREALGDAEFVEALLLLYDTKTKVGSNSMRKP